MSTRSPHVRLAAHGLTARVDPLGAALADLRAAGRPLVLGYADGEERPAYAGAVLVPWPNRLRDGEYTWQGRRHHAPVTEPERDTALHGLLDVVTTEVVEATDDRVVLDATLPAGEAYPSTLAVRVTYRLEPDGLHGEVRTRNTGEVPAPYGVGCHPYLVAGDGPVDDWHLRLPARTVAVLEAERLLPTGEAVPLAEAVATGEVPDLAGGAALAGVVLDHLLTDVVPAPDGAAGAVLTGPDGRGVAVSAGPWARWWQVFTSDTVPGERHRRGVAVEPMSCPGDAFRSGTDLVVLDPGEEHVAAWHLAPVGPPGGA